MPITRDGLMQRRIIDKIIVNKGWDEFQPDSLV